LVGAKHKINSLVIVKPLLKIEIMSEINEKSKLNAAAEAQEENSFDSWLGDLEEKDQPQACSIDNPDCEACGS
jgi:hypothetical protein